MGRSSGWSRASTISSPGPDEPEVPWQKNDRVWWLRGQLVPERSEFEPFSAPNVEIYNADNLIGLFLLEQSFIEFPNPT